jgi:hypothetical protein
MLRADPHDGAVVRYADQEVASFGVEESGDGLQHGVRDVLVVLTALLEAEAQRGLELERLRLALLDHCQGPPGGQVPAKV